MAVIFSAATTENFLPERLKVKWLLSKFAYANFVLNSGELKGCTL